MTLLLLALAALRLPHASVATKRVMLWTTNDLANTNETVRAAFMAELASVKDIVDVVSPCSYYIQQTPPHGLIRKKGANSLHTALRGAGFKLQPLVGDIAGGWNMSWYRDTFGPVHGPTFADAAAQEILAGNFLGLNWDYEPHQPGTLNDSVLFGHMVRDTIYQSRHPVSSICFPCSGKLCDPASLSANTPTTIKLMDMSTYAGSNTSNETQWAHDMRAHMVSVGGSSRYGMGVCPSCSRGLTAAKISARLAAAESAGVEEIDVWCNVDPSDPDAMLWWAALRKWKRAKPSPPPPAPSPPPAPKPKPIQCNPAARPPEHCPGGLVCPSSGVCGKVAHPVLGRAGRKLEPVAQEPYYAVDVNRAGPAGMNVLFDHYHHPETTDFAINNGPSYIRLLDGTDAIVIRSCVNRTGCSTPGNPDVVTLVKRSKDPVDVNNLQKQFGRNSLARIILRPEGADEQCGVQDVRVSQKRAYSCVVWNVLSLLH